MPNANRPTGLTPRKSVNIPWAGQLNLYCIDAAYATGLAIGDPIKTTGTADSRGYPMIALAAPGDTIRGVIQGLGTDRGLIANPGNLDSTVRPGVAQAKNWYALVVDEPECIFEIQASTAITAADVGLNADIIAGPNNGWVSSVQMAAPTAAGATAQLRILGITDVFDNEFGLYAKVLVKINEHELASTTGT